MLRIVLIKTAIIANYLMPCQSILFAQEVAPVAVVEIPPSPSIKGLNKYGDIPVNFYTGIPDISIPLFTFQQGDISLPVTVSYHASGFKVDEIASEVGLGWSLPLKGYISRVVRGLPDESANGYLSVTSRENIYGVNSNNTQDAINKYDNFDLMNNASDGLWDLEPDVYSFSFNGRSGKFTIKADSSIMLFPYQNLKIIPPTLSSSGFSNGIWKIITEDGFSYTFGSSGYVEETYNPQQDFIPNFVSSWVLKKIESPRGHTVNFGYSEHEIETVMPLSEVDYHTISGGGSCGMASNSDQLTLFIKTQQLESVISQNQSIDLIYKLTEREDLPGSFALSEIVHSDEICDEFISKYNFHHAYFNPNTSSTEKRLKLTKLDRLLPLNDQVDQRHTFAYNESINLPDRASLSKDHWGYFNNKNNSTLIPAMTFNDSYLSGADRQTSEPHSLAYLLTAINYPTGGYSAFYYEGNKYIKPEEVFNDIPHSINMINAGIGEEDLISFNITFDQEIELNFTIDYDNQFGNDVSGAYVVIENASSSQVVFGSDHTEGDYNNTLSMTAGNYILKLINEDLPGTSMSASFNSRISLGIQPVEYLVGGARIKKIENNANNGALPVIRHFKYDEYEAHVLNDVNLSGYTYQLCQPDAGSPNTCECSFLVRNSNSRLISNSTNIGYPKVSEISGSLSEPIGHRDYVFYSVSDAGGGGYPFPPRLPYNWRQGLLKSTSVYDNNNELKTKIINYNSFLQLDHSNGMKIGKVKAPNPDYPQSYITLFEFTTYLFGEVSEFVSLDSVVMETYEGDEKLSQKTHYQYSSDFHQLKEKSIIDSKGNTHTTTLTYPRSYESSGFIQNFVSHHIISPVIERLEYKNGRIIAGELKDFQIVDGSPVLNNQYILVLDQPIDPQFFIASTMTSGSFSFDNRFESLVHVSEYELTFKNPLTYQTESVQKSYIWGFNNSKVICEAIGCSASQIAYSSFETNDTGNWLNSNIGNTNDAYIGSKSFIGSINSHTLPTDDYIVSLWAKGSGTVTVNGLSRSVNNTWRYYEWILPDTQNVSINSDGNLIDEVRLHPMGVFMKTWTYVKRGSIGTTTDMNNQTIYYEYDEVGRLIRERNNDFNILRSFKYHFRNNE